MKNQKLVESKFCKSDGEDPLCYSEECNCGKPIRLLNNAVRGELDELEETYCIAANALNKYRDARGFNPGVRVEARYRDEPVVFGVIAPYGDDWSRVDEMHVPVIKDNGRWQPWKMSDLTVVPTSTETPATSE